MRSIFGRSRHPAVIAERHFLAQRQFALGPIGDAAF
jgi:hypothetical protein